MRPFTGMQTVIYVVQDGREIVNTFPRRSRKEWSGTLADFADQDATEFDEHLKSRQQPDREQDHLDIAIALTKHNLGMDNRLTDDPRANAALIFTLLGGGRHNTRLALRVLLACGLTVADILSTKDNPHD